MKEFDAGTLKSSSGQKVTNPKQAVAIGLSEERAMGKDVAPPPKGTSKANPGLVEDNERRGKTAYGYAPNRPEKESAAEDRGEKARGITEKDEKRTQGSASLHRNVLTSFKG